MLELFLFLLPEILPLLMTGSILLVADDDTDDCDAQFYKSAVLYCNAAVLDIFFECSPYLLGIV